MSSADLAALVVERQPCVVLTGAGISTESGIPDFRSPAGIWAEVDPLEVASIRAFKRDPERVWGFYRTRIHSLLAAEPNAGHLALAELERRGLVQAIVTQNIDTLHSRAGSREVVEVHGSIRAAEQRRRRSQVRLRRRAQAGALRRRRLARGCEAGGPQAQRKARKAALTPTPPGAHASA